MTVHPGVHSGRAENSLETASQPDPQDRMRGWRGHRRKSKVACSDCLHFIFEKKSFRLLIVLRELHIYFGPIRNLGIPFLINRHVDQRWVNRFLHQPPAWLWLWTDSTQNSEAHAVFMILDPMAFATCMLWDEVHVSVSPSPIQPIPSLLRPTFVPEIGELWLTSPLISSTHQLRNLFFMVFYHLYPCELLLAFLEV